MRIFNMFALTFALLATGFLDAQPTPSQSGFEMKNSAATTTIKWQTETQNLGEIEQGKPATVYFELENTGSAPLIITKVKTSCGCTVSEYEKEPILPGESSKIKAVYNAKNKGAFTKTITVYANTDQGAKSLIIKGKVI